MSQRKYANGAITRTLGFTLLKTMEMAVITQSTVADMNTVPIVVYYGIMVMVYYGYCIMWGKLVCRCNG